MRRERWVLAACTLIIFIEIFWSDLVWCQGGGGWEILGWAGEMGKNRLIKVQSALLRPFHPPATEEAGAMGGDEL